MSSSAVLKKMVKEDHFKHYLDHQMSTEMVQENQQEKVNTKGFQYAK